MGKSALGTDWRMIPLLARSIGALLQEWLQDKSSSSIYASPLCIREGHRCTTLAASNARWDGRWLLRHSRHWPTVTICHHLTCCCRKHATWHPIVHTQHRLFVHVKELWLECLKYTTFMLFFLVQFDRSSFQIFLVFSSSELTHSWIFHDLLNAATREPCSLPHNLWVTTVMIITNETQPLYV